MTLDKKVLGSIAGLATLGAAQGDVVTIDDDFLNYGNYDSLSVVNNQVFAGGDIFGAHNLTGGVISTQGGSGYTGRAFNEVNGNNYGTNGGSIFNFTTNGSTSSLLNNSSFAAFALDLMEADLNGNFAVQNEMTGESHMYNNFFGSGVTAMTAELVNGEMNLFFGRDIDANLYQARILGNLYDGTATLDIVDMFGFDGSLLAGLPLKGVDLYDNNSRVAFSNTDGVGSGNIAIVPTPASGLLGLVGLGMMGAYKRRK